MNLTPKISKLIVEVIDNRKTAGDNDK